MKKAPAILTAILILMLTSSCSQCNRTGQMIDWRAKGAAEAAKTLAPADSCKVNQDLL